MIDRLHDIIEEKRKECLTMANKIVATTAERLRYAISYRHTTAAQVSKETNISRGSLSQYISGKFSPKQDRIYILAKHLRVSPAWLMGIDVPMEEGAKPTPTMPIHSEVYSSVESSLHELTDILINKQGELYIVTPSEKELLRKYRLLDYDKRQLLYSMLDTLSQQQQNAPTTTANSDEGES